MQADAVQTRTDPNAMPAAASGGRDNAAGRVTELRVSANLMTLETGVYCVFPAPGSRAPDPMTGLPGVRITPCPGIAGRPEAVSISTFREDGWIDNTAALVRVTDGPGQVLVTIYQAAGRSPEMAPKLQVMRLSSDPTAAVTAPGPDQQAPVAEEPDLMAHIQGSGDVPAKFGAWIGERGSRNWIEGFGISDKTVLPPGDIEYQGVLGKGWNSPWVDNGKFCGSRGMALPLLGLSVRLKGATAKDFTLRYSATFVDGSAVGPVAEGTACEAPGLAALEAFMIEVVPKTAAAPAKAKAAKPAPVKAAGKPARR